MPSYGHGVPRIIKYMSLMLVSATIVLTETVSLKLLMQSNRSSPKWVKSFSDFLSENYIMKCFVLAPFDIVEVENEIIPLPTTTSSENEEDPAVETVKNEEKSKNECEVFCRFIDRTLFIVLIVCYVKYDGY